MTLPVAAAEQASGTIRCLIRMFKDTSRPSEKLMTALSRACASQRVEAPSRITAWRAAANLAPDSSAILAMLGSSLASNNLSTTGGERDELIRDSAEVLKRALQLEPGLTDAQANLAMLESQSNPTEWNKRLAGILAAPRSGVELVESAVPDMLRGAGLVTVGQFADAIPHLQHAVQADPLFPAPQLWLSMSLMENGQIREGRAMYEQELSRRASPTYWNAWAMQEFSDPVGLEHALKLVPAGISADTTDCLRGLAVALADKHPEARARSAEPVLACMRRIPGGFFLIPAASALGYLDEAFAAAVDAVDAGDALFLLHLKVNSAHARRPAFPAADEEVRRLPVLARHENAAGLVQAARGTGLRNLCGAAKGTRDVDRRSTEFEVEITDQTRTPVGDLIQKRRGPLEN